MNTQQIKSIAFDVVDDLESCLNRAKGLLYYSSTKDKKIFLAMAAIILLIILFHSHSESSFYLNLMKVLFISFVSFLIMVLSDTFWFLIKKKAMYKWNIKNKNIATLLIRAGKNEEKLNSKNINAEILTTALFYSQEYKYHAKRNGFEICLILLLLFFTFPSFVLFNIALFCAMFVYVFLYEQQSVEQVFDDISSLILLIGMSYKNNSKACEKFIINNNKQEIRDLKMLYDVVLKTQM